jgi:hypothetical protein
MEKIGFISTVLMTDAFPLKMCETMIISRIVMHEDSLERTVSEASKPKCTVPKEAMFKLFQIFLCIPGILYKGLGFGSSGRA